MQNKKAYTINGFTLLEILIALFIFTILSMILVNALHNVINISATTEKNAERLRNLQFALLTMSRDIEQTVNRPVLNTAGTEEEAFIGTPRYFTFTHMGFANPTGELARSSLQRTQYAWNQGVLWRKTWTELDQAPQSLPHARELLEITDANFKYLDHKGRFQNNWPPSEGREDPLPLAVSIHLVIPNWGRLSQLYVISAQSKQTPPNLPEA